MVSGVDLLAASQIERFGYCSASIHCNPVIDTFQILVGEAIFPVESIVYFHCYRTEDLSSSQHWGQSQLFTPKCRPLVQSEHVRLEMRRSYWSENSFHSWKATQVKCIVRDLLLHIDLTCSVSYQDKWLVWCLFF